MLFDSGALVTHNKTCLLPLAVLLVGLSLFSMVDTVQAQSISFTSQDVFAIPNVDGTIRFSVNGSYASATLDNDTWVFNNLTFSGSRVSGTLKFSAKNCDVVIHSFTPSSVVGGNNTRRLGSVRYTVEGTGEQVINLGFDSSRPSHVSEWSVINQDSVFFSDGKDWKLLADDTVIVRGLSGTLTVVRYNFGLTVDDRPFYLRHSVIISTAIAVAITVTLATIIKIKTTSKRSLP
jgi:hypothetical protein